MTNVKINILITPLIPTSLITTLEIALLRANGLDVSPAEDGFVSIQGSIDPEVTPSLDGILLEDIINGRNTPLNKSYFNSKRELYVEPGADIYKDIFQNIIKRSEGRIPHLCAIGTSDDASIIGRMDDFVGVIAAEDYQVKDNHEALCEIKESLINPPALSLNKFPESDEYYDLVEENSSCVQVNVGEIALFIRKKEDGVVVDARHKDNTYSTRLGQLRAYAADDGPTMRSR